jgi:hypothetical protein
MDSKDGLAGLANAARALRPDAAAMHGIVARSPNADPDAASAARRTSATRAIAANSRRRGATAPVRAGASVAPRSRLSRYRRRPTAHRP